MRDRDQRCRGELGADHLLHLRVQVEVDCGGALVKDD